VADLGIDQVGCPESPSHATGRKLPLRPTDILPACQDRDQDGRIYDGHGVVALLSAELMLDGDDLLGG
jgi:hypothetical protein